jgi:hypothetical protein
MGDIPLLAWWRTDEDAMIPTVTGGLNSDIVRWTDKVGGRVLLPVPGQNAGYLSNSGTDYLGNAVRCVSLSGRRMAMYSPHNLPTTSEVWIFCISRSTASAAGGVFTYGATNHNQWGSWGRGIGWNFATNQYANAWQGDSGPGYAQVSLPDNNRTLTAAHLTPDSVDIWWKGVFQSGSACGPTGVLNTGIWLGQEVGGDGGGECGDIIVTGPLTTPQRQYVEGYLMWKFGHQSLLPAGHLYQLAPPPAPG